jgi:hypothetical protein
VLQHDNTTPHTSLETLEALTNDVWILLIHPPYSPIQHPKISNELELWKIQSMVQFYTDDDDDDGDGDVIPSAWTWLREQHKACTHLFLVGTEL